jgi:MFS transporter, SHS family, lactate transporter
VYVIILTFLGPEHLGKNFDVSHDEDMAEVAGRTTAHEKGEGMMRERARDGGSGSDQGDPEKAVSRNVEG